MASVGDILFSPMVVFPLSVVAASVATFIGHKRFFSNLVVGSVLLGFFATFFLLEIIFLILTPYRLLTKKTPVSPDEAAAVAAGSATFYSEGLSFLMESVFSAIALDSLSWPTCQIQTSFRLFPSKMPSQILM